jgi:hypothetical protein
MLAPTTTRGLGARTVATLIGCSSQRAVAGEADHRFVFCSDASLVVPGQQVGGPWGTQYEPSAAYFIGCMFSGCPHTPSRLGIFFDPCFDASVDQAALMAVDLGIHLSACSR